MHSNLIDEKIIKWKNVKMNIASEKLMKNKNESWKNEKWDE